jgi:pimeloyl-ACP methyl ester carboxylesterase
VSAGKRERAACGPRLAALGGAGLAAALGLAVVYANRQLAAVETLDPEAAAPDGQFITVDGVRLHYLDGGARTGDRPPVLLLHGFGASTTTWRHTLPALASHERVLALDFPGHGYSERVTTPTYSLRRTANLVAGFLTALDIGRAVVVGNSMGGAVALQLAISHPRRVDRLVVVDAVGDSAGPRRPPAALLRLLTAGPLGRALIYYTFCNPAFARRGLALSYADPARLTEAAVTGYRAPLRVRGTAQALVAMTLSPPDSDLPHRLPTITAPTRILWGADDRLIPLTTGERLRDRIPGSRLTVLPHCGHLPQEECPALFHAALNAFLAEGRAPGGRS